MADLDILAKFDNSLGPVTAGLYLHQRNWLFSGHASGTVLWTELKTGKQTVVHRQPGGMISAITINEKGEVIIGSRTGAIFTLSLADLGAVKEIRKAEYTKTATVWRASWSGVDDFFVGMNYGGFQRFRRKKSSWEESHVYGHTNAIFGLAASGKSIVTGDYQGFVEIWERNSETKQLDSFNVMSGVQGVAWYQDKAFALVTKHGGFHFFEYDRTDNRYRKAASIGIGTGEGRCITFSEDGKTIFAATTSELVQFNLETYGARTLSMTGSVDIWEKKGVLYVLTETEFVKLEALKLEVPPEYQKFKHIKVSVIGHTEVGKSTLCKKLAHGSGEVTESTYGKIVWPWKLQSSQGLDRIVMLHDHGGQEAVLESYYPFLLDSDIIVVMFQQNDRSTYDKAISALSELGEVLPSDTPIVMIETHIDKGVDSALAEVPLKQMMKERKIAGHLKANLTEQKDIERIREFLLGLIDWSRARVTLQSESASNLQALVGEIKSQGTPYVSFNELKRLYEKKTGRPIPNPHLRFLLENLASEGVVEYYFEKLDRIIINDKSYNKLRSTVLMRARSTNGILQYSELEKEFSGQLGYLQVLDEFLNTYRISIANEDKRIFPAHLSDRALKISPDLQQAMKSAQPITGQFIPARQAQSQLIKMLSDENLQCHDVSKTAGLFSWTDAAAVYYTVSLEKNDVSGDLLTAKWYVVGRKKDSRDRLQGLFKSFLESILQPHLQEDGGQKKKASPSGQSYEFDVAISFSRSQREFAKNLANRLKILGLHVFFDEDYEADIWGKDLVEYLVDVYSIKARFCVILVSGEYASGAYTNLERKAALVRQLEQKGEYILPIQFDNTKLPGLLSTTGHLSAAIGIERIADNLVKKIEQA